MTAWLARLVCDLPWITPSRILASGTGEGVALRCGSNLGLQTEAFYVEPVREGALRRFNDRDRIIFNRTVKIRKCREMQIAPLNIVVIIASTGRPTELGQLVERLSLQSRKPDRIIVSISSDDDLPDDIGKIVDIVKGPKGLCGQRNRGLALGLAQSDIIAFFDDDYIPSLTALEKIEQVFEQYPDIVGLNGHLLADGARGAGISYRDAIALIEQYDRIDEELLEIEPRPDGLYGCNMAFRSAAIADARFDENLPLYGWQEDIDFSATIARNGGRLVKTNAFAGVHCGTKSGRTSGKRLGYSQIINPIYLIRKGTMSVGFAGKLMMRNVASNIYKVIYPEPWIDRRGRLFGNMIAIADLLRGKIDPKSVLQL